jgi:hypothetical protein
MSGVFGGESYKIGSSVLQSSPGLPDLRRRAAEARQRAEAAKGRFYEAEEAGRQSRTGSGSIFSRHYVVPGITLAAGAVFIPSISKSLTNGAATRLGSKFVDSHHGSGDKS